MAQFRRARSVALCRVSYRDIEGVTHSVEITAESLYEAVAQAVARFRRDEGWGMHPPSPGCQFHVVVMRDSPIEYSIGLSKVETFAQHGTAKGPRDILRRSECGSCWG